MPFQGVESSSPKQPPCSFCCLNPMSRKGRSGQLERKRMEIWSPSAVNRSTSNCSKTPTFKGGGCKTSPNTFGSVRGDHPGTAELKSQGIIVPTHLPLNSPIWPVNKPNGKWRLTVDYLGIILGAGSVGRKQDSCMAGKQGKKYWQLQNINPFLWDAHQSSTDPTALLNIWVDSLTCLALAKTEEKRDEDKWSSLIEWLHIKWGCSGVKDLFTEVGSDQRAL